MTGPVWLVVRFAFAASQPVIAEPIRQGDSAIISDELECPNCRLKILRTTMIGDGTGSDQIRDQVNAVRVDALGRYWVLAGDRAPLVFDSVGRRIGRVGESGSGPNARVRPLDVVTLPGDSTLLFDGELSRLTVFDRTLTAVRSVQLENAMRPWLVLRWPSSVVANGQLGSPESAGWPLHLGSVGADGFVLRQSFGPGDGEIRPMDYGQPGQLLAPSGEANSFWSSDESLYRLSLWNTEGVRKLQLERHPTWFVSEPGSNPLGGRNKPPQPRVSCFAEDTNRYLWVAVRLPKITWREGWPKVTGNEVPVSAMAFNKMFRTTVEVLNPRSRRVVARFDMEDWILDCLPDRRFAMSVRAADGSFHVKIVQFDLLR